VIVAFKRRSGTEVSMCVRALLAVSLLTVVVVVAGCAGESRYVTADEVTDELNAEFSDTDFRLMANEIADSFVRCPAVGGQETPPRVAMLGIKNSTSEYINTDNIADKIMLALMRTGKVQMVDRAILGDVTRELKLSESGFVDPQFYKSFGMAASADLLMTGELTSIEKREGRKTLMWYRLSVRLVDVETTTVVCMEEKEIKKESVRGIFGM
jgi:uncharacterized protein (TIGR02722 family)